MQSTLQSSPLIRFGMFEADLRSGELRKNGIKVKVQDLPFRALKLFLNHPNEMSPRLTNGTPWLREVKRYYSVVAKLEKKLPINPASRFHMGGFRDEDLFALCRGGSRPKSCARSRSTSGSPFGIDASSRLRYG